MKAAPSRLLAALLGLEQLPLQVRHLCLGLSSLVQIALDLAAQIFCRLLAFQQLVGQIYCGQHRCIHPGDLASQQLAHFFIHQPGHLLHVAGCLISHQRIFLIADRHRYSICHSSLLHSDIILVCLTHLFNLLYHIFSIRKGFSAGKVNFLKKRLCAGGQMKGAKQVLSEKVTGGALRTGNFRVK